MAKRDTAEPVEPIEHVQVADPEGPPVPRLTANDGQGYLATPVEEYDDPSLHSDLNPPPDEDEVDEGGGEEIAEQTPEASADDTSTISVPAPTQSGLSDEDRYFIELGRRAAMQAATAGRQPQPQPRAVQDEDDVDDGEPLDPEVEKLAKHTARILRKQIKPLIDNTQQITEAYRESRERAAQAEDRNIAKSTLDSFLTTNAFTRADKEAAEWVREEIQEQIDQHFAAAAAGYDVGRVDPRKIIDIATKKAARAQKAFASRSVRHTQERTAVANATRSTAGGSTPRHGVAPPQKTPAQRSREMEMNLKKIGMG